MSATTAPGRGRRPGRPDGPAEVLIALFEGPLAASGFDLEEVEVRRAGSRHVVAVSIDRDGGIDLDAVADASRVVSATLDDAAAGALPPALLSPYTLEVASRGVDSPLTAPRHWRRAIGRLVEVRRHDAPAITGRVLAVTDDGVELDVPKTGPVEVSFGEVGRALVQIEFNRPADAAGPALPDDFDELSESDELAAADESDEPADSGEMEDEIPS